MTDKKKMPPEDMGFLHRHIQTERTTMVGPNHVIVDKEDWEQARKAYYGSE